MKRKHIAFALLGLISLNVGLFTGRWVEGTRGHERVRLGLRSAELCGPDGVCRTLPLRVLLREDAQRAPLTTTDGTLGNVLFVWGIAFTLMVLIACRNHLRDGGRLLLRISASTSAFTALAAWAFVAQTPNYLSSSWSFSLFFVGCVDLFIDLSHVLLTSDVFDEVSGSQIGLDAEGPIVKGADISAHATTALSGAGGAATAPGVPTVDRQRVHGGAVPAPLRESAPEPRGAVSGVLLSPHEQLRRSSAQLLSFDQAGITILRPGRLQRMVPWASIVEIDLFRVPPDAPFDGAIVLDLWTAMDQSTPSIRLLKTTEGNFAAIDPHGSQDYRTRFRALIVHLKLGNPQLEIASELQPFVEGTGDPPRLTSAAEVSAHLKRVLRSDR